MKKKLVLSLILAILLLWFGFGFAYFKIAKQDSKSFIFQEKIDLESKISLVKEKMECKDIELIKEIIINEEYKLEEIYIEIQEKTSSEYPYIYVEGIGENWAEWYENKLLIFNNDGIYIHTRMFTCSIKYEINNYGRPDIVFIEEYPDFKNESLLDIELKFYAGCSTPIPSAEMRYVDNYFAEYDTVLFTKNILIKESDFKKFLNGNSKTLSTLLSKSLVFLDEDKHIFFELIENSNSHTFLDYLYFSAITLTTTGFGDIIPNSTEVRVCVMVESIIGIILAGALISTLFMQFNVNK